MTGNRAGQYISNGFRRIVYIFASGIFKCIDNFIINPSISEEALFTRHGHFVEYQGLIIMAHAGSYLTGSLAYSAECTHSGAECLRLKLIRPSS